jgi:3-oxoacyl-[acyl-carrier protein] reductase
MKCDGKVAIVLGASRGIGLACAEHLAREGATVVATGRSLEAVAPALSAADAAGTEGLGVEVDVSRG